MNYQKYFKSTALINNPLCGIDTYKDVLNLATGQITRQIKKLVLDGTESWIQTVPEVKVYRIIVSDYLRETDNIPICTHYKGIAPVAGTGALQDLETAFLISSSGNNYYYIRDDNFNNANDFIAYLQQQYANDTPVTIWYILVESETEQITVPSGLSGTVEGYLTQTGTPTPSDPIYPVANDAVGWYAIRNYVRNTTWQDGSTYSRSGGSWSSSLTKKWSRKRK